MNKGLMAFVYRNGSDCSNNGPSKFFDAFVVILPEGGPFEPKENMPAMELDRREVLSKALNRDCTIAVPVSLKGKTVMFGGNFLYTSDSRFPVSHPIPIHDRVEGV